VARYIGDEAGVEMESSAILAARLHAEVSSPMRAEVTEGATVAKGTEFASTFVRLVTVFRWTA